MISVFEQTLQRMSDIYHKKNEDYGNSFDETCNKFGIVAAIVRMWDKMNRVTQLARTGEQNVADERVEDTLIDLANYAILTYCWLKIQPKKYEIGNA